MSVARITVLMVGLSFVAGMLVLFVPPLVSIGSLLLIAAFALSLVGLPAFSSSLADRLVLLVLLASSVISSSLEFPDAPPYHRGGSPLAFCLLPTDFALLFAFVHLALRQQTSGPLTDRFRRFLVWAIAWLLVGLLSATVATYPGYALAEIARVVRVVFLCFVVFKLTSTWDSSATLGRGLAVLVAIEAVLAILQATNADVRELHIPALGLREPFFSRELYRPGGTLAHPNGLAMFLLIGLAFLLQRISVRPTTLSKGLLYAGALTATLLGFAGLVRTASRGAMLGAVAMAATWVIYPYLSARLNSRRVLWSAVFFLGLLSGIALLSGDVLSTRFADIGSDTASVSRYDLARTAFQMFIAHPFIGVGLNNFAEVFADYPVIGLQYLPPYHPVHHILLLPLSETGLCGFVAFASLLLVIAREAVDLARDTRASVALEARPFVAAFVGVFVHSQVDWVVFTNCAFAQVALVLGVFFSLRARRRP